MKKGNVSTGNKSSGGSDASNQFHKPNDNDTIEMAAEQLASLLLDYVQSRRVSGFKKLHRRG